MWKARPDDPPSSANPSGQKPLTPASTSASALGKESQLMQPAKTQAETFRGDVAAHIGKSVVLKGELSGSEDLYLDGEVEGTIALSNHKIVVGPNGRVRANISAREAVLHGHIEGNITVSERVELKKACVLTGDITARRIVVEEGAFFKGSVDLGSDGKGELSRSAAAGVGISPVAPPTAQTSFMEHS